MMRGSRLGSVPEIRIDAATMASWARSLRVMMIARAKCHGYMHCPGCVTLLTPQTLWDVLPVWWRAAWLSNRTRSRDVAPDEHDDSDAYGDYEPCLNGQVTELANKFA